MTYIDLSMPLNADTPVYPGNSKVKIDVEEQFKKDGCLGHSLNMGSHSGTHLDAPGHMIEGGKMLDVFPVDTFIGTGKLVDVRDGFSREALEQANIQEGDIVLFYTGASEKYQSPDYYETAPAISDEAADYVINKKAKIAGVDTGSADDAPFTIHKKLLGNNILIIENLVNLKQLLGKLFIIYALPLNLNIEGSPARVVAVVQRA